MNNFLGQLYLISTPVQFFIFALMIKCLLVSFYCGILFLLMYGIREGLSHKMSVQTIYYSWYTLLLSLPLSNFGWNRFIKQPLYGGFFSPEFGTFCKMTGLLWLIAVTYKTVKFCVVNHKIRSAIKIMEHCSAIDVLARQAAGTVGIKRRNIHLACSDLVSSPASYGFLRQTILLPKDYLTKYTPAELSLLLLHEMFHIKNHDTAKLYILYWVQCFVWIPEKVCKDFRRDTEMLCDNRVLGVRHGARNNYGDLLLKECSGQNKLHGLAFSDSYCSLQYRIQALYSHRPEQKRFAVIRALVVLALMISFAWFYFNPAAWLHINENESTQVEITLMCMDNTTEESFVLLREDDSFRDTCQIQDGVLQVDKVALYKVVSGMDIQGSSIEGVFIRMLSNPNDYGFLADKIELTKYEAYGIHISDLESANENNRFFHATLDDGNAEEMIYLTIARWL